MDKELLIELDKVLVECRNDGYISMTKDTDGLTRKAINEAVARGWLYKYNSYTYKLDSPGIDVLDFGTVEQFLLDKKSKRDSIPTSTPTTVIKAKNVVYGDTYGDINQSSGGSRDITTNMTSSPIPSEIKHKPPTSPMLNVWWKIVVPIIVGIIVFIISKRYF